jgi:RNA polymerase sigma-70 factor (ECF subfamily)
MTGNTAEAEDLTQDAFLQVFRKIAAFRGESAFATWLHRIAVNTVLMHFRKQPRGQVSLDEPYESDSPKARHEYGIRDRYQVGCIDRIALARAVEQLPPGYRTIFLLHEVEGYEHQEIAEMLSCTAGNSKSQLHKARQRFRELLTSSPEAQSPVQSVESRGNKRAIPKPKDWSPRIGKENKNTTNSDRSPIEKADPVTGVGYRD